MAAKRIIQLANGVKMPALGFGTWLAEPGVAAAGVQTALRAGYRHIDCASRYMNEEEIGNSLSDYFQKNASVQRPDVFLTGKLWSQDFTRIRESCEKSLKDLKVDYLDQYLVHHPVEIPVDCKAFFPEKAEDLIYWEPNRFQEIWQDMEKLYEDGLVRSIGVCNFTQHKLSEIIKRSPQVIPHTVQNEFHPYLPQWNLVEYCKSKGISMTAFSSLGNRERPPQMIEDDDPTLLEDPIISSVAQKHNCSNAQVLLAWGMQRGIAVLTRSKHEHEVEDSFKSLSLELDEEEMNKINGITTRCRFLKAKWFTLSGLTVEETWDHELLG